MTTPKPTATELITILDDEIDVVNPGQEHKVVPVALLEVLRAHLSDPWISVEERLPEDSGDYLIHFGHFSDMRVGFFSDKYRCWLDNWGMEPFEKDVLAWCPLPPLPKKAGEA